MLECPGIAAGALPRGAKKSILGVLQSYLAIDIHRLQHRFSIWKSQPGIQIETALQCRLQQRQTAWRHAGGYNRLEPMRWSLQQGAQRLIEFDIADPTG